MKDLSVNFVFKFLYNLVNFIIKVFTFSQLKRENYNKNKTSIGKDNNIALVLQGE